VLRCQRVQAQSHAVPAGSQIVAEQQSLSDVSPMQPPLGSTAWMCRSRTARPRPPAQRGDPAPPRLPSQLLSCLSVPNSSDSAAGGRERLLPTLPSPALTPVAPATPRRLKSPRHPRGPAAAARAEAGSVQGVLPSPQARPEVFGILALLRTPAVSSTSRTLSRGHPEVLGTAEAGRAAEGKGLHQLHSPHSSRHSPGKPRKWRLYVGGSHCSAGWGGLLSPPAPRAAPHLHHLPCPPGFPLEKVGRVQVRREQPEFIVGANW